MRKSVLVVDDEAVVVEIAKRKLEDVGYKVLTASGGVQALEQLKSIRPDLIILDIQMEGMNGYTFILEKDKVPEFAQIPVIVLTAHAEVEPLFKRHGVKAYFLKPLKLPDLIKQVIEVIGRP